MKPGRSPLETVGLWTASLLGAGRSPIVPGTVGTLASLPLVIVTGYFLPTWGYLAVTAIVIAVSIWSAGVAARVLKAFGGCVFGFFLAVLILSHITALPYRAG